MMAHHSRHPRHPGHRSYRPRVFLLLAAVAGILLSSFSGPVLGDLYGHAPRFSNNRLNEQSAERTNANRLFDSQNNNRGGYNVGDKTSQPFNQNNPEYPPAQMYDFNDVTTPMQYSEVFFEGSKMTLEWTHQHGCGGRESPQIDPVTGEILPTDPHKLNCNIVIQYMCETDATVTDPGMTVHEIRNGGNTGTSDVATEPGDIAGVMTQNRNNRRGLHESEAYWFECATRERNKGLFTADQNLKGDTARYTRQNPDANRYGQECPEERDHFPYWKPTPWRDIAYLTDNITHCETFVKSNSINNNQVCKCTSGTNYVQNPSATVKDYIRVLTEQECDAVGGEWKCFTHGIPAPVCRAAPWTRVNHLGNVETGQMASFNWTLPSFEQLVGVKKTDGLAKCVLRMRYNMTTDDYDPHSTFADQNHDPANGVRSPVTNNPYVDVGANFQTLRLAINTAQFGRTFQDRTHAFYIKQRPTGLRGANIVNIMVRGKRGNIVQTYPGTEYDFTPTRLHAPVGTIFHVQWTGSNTHNNGNPAGDGQAGDAGEGRGGTDRHNMVQIEDLSDNYPIPLDKYWSLGAESDWKLMWRHGKCWDMNYVPISSSESDPSCPLIMATSGYFRTVAQLQAAVAAAGDGEIGFDPLLNESPASLIGGVLLQINAPGHYHYMCTRNNNFSNRSQKATIVVDPEED